MNHFGSYDSRGQFRGKCTSGYCNCPGFVSKDDNKCGRCQHHAPAHQAEQAPLPHSNYSPPTQSAERCALPGCNKSVYVEGHTRHDFCSRTHATEAKKRGIVPVSGQSAKPGFWDQVTDFFAPSAPAVNTKPGPHKGGGHKPNGAPPANNSRATSSSPPPGQLYFYHRNEPYYCFTNFYDCHNLVIEERNWPTSEHYFQAKKYAVDGEVPVTAYDLINSVKSPNELSDIKRLLLPCRSPALPDIELKPLFKNLLFGNGDRLQPILKQLGRDIHCAGRHDSYCSALMEFRDFYTLPPNYSATDIASPYFRELHPATWQAVPFTFDNKLWFSIEQVVLAKQYQAVLAFDIVRFLPSPRDAFDFTRKYPLASQRWHQVKIDVMKNALRAKFTQDGHLKNKLLGTGELKLVEHTANDNFWGDGLDGSGQNMLGCLLMEIRDELRKYPSPAGHTSMSPRPSDMRTANYPTTTYHSRPDATSSEDMRTANDPPTTYQPYPSPAKPSAPPLNVPYEDGRAPSEPNGAPFNAGASQSSYSKGYGSQANSAGSSYDSRTGSSSMPNTAGKESHPNVTVREKSSEDPPLSSAYSHSVPSSSNSVGANTYSHSVPSSSNSVGVAPLHEHDLYITARVYIKFQEGWLACNHRRVFISEDNPACFILNRLSKSRETGWLLQILWSTESLTKYLEGRDDDHSVQLVEPNSPKTWLAVYQPVKGVFNLRSKLDDPNSCLGLFPAPEFSTGPPSGGPQI